LEEVGQLAHPPPKLAEIENDVFRDYAWLADLTDGEAVFAKADAGDRGKIIEAVRGLPRSAISEHANLF